MKHTLETYKLFFGSLSNPNRLQIIYSIKDKEKNIIEIAKTTGFEQTMISHNLKRLERCGMVFFRREGKYKYYSLNQKTMKPLLKFIDEHMSTYCVHVIKGER
jgi:DNA-binding transcriptional ArsR family regulator